MPKAKVYVLTAGNTLGCHEKFLTKVKKKISAKVMQNPEDSDVAFVFCPIVSRFESDVTSALSIIPDKAPRNVILVAMHHTFDPNYVLPSQRELDNPAVTLLVDCLFFENKGLLKCPRNKIAIKAVTKQLKQKSTRGL